MIYLLDTHIAVWAVSEPDRLTEKERNLLEGEPSEIAVSVVSLWEIAIKQKHSRAEKSQFRVSTGDAYTLFTEAKFQILPIVPSHIIALETLTIQHKDPFDRLLIAQALAENLALITRDSILRTYLV